MRSTPRTAPRRRLESAKRALVASQAQIAVVDAQKKSIDIQIDKTEVQGARPTAWCWRATPRSAASCRRRAGRCSGSPSTTSSSSSADVAETALPRLAEGMPSAISVAGWGAPVEGKIRLIAPEVNQASRLGMIRISLPSNPAAARRQFRPRRDRDRAPPRRRGAGLGGHLCRRDAFLQKVENGRSRPCRSKLGARADGYVEVVSRHCAKATKWCRAPAPSSPTATWSRRCAASRRERSS